MVDGDGFTQQSATSRAKHVVKPLGYTLETRKQQACCIRDSDAHIFSITSVLFGPRCAGFCLPHSVTSRALSQLQKRKQIAESLREMNRENVAKLAAREKQKLIDAEEDKRLMKEYRERLDRQEEGGRGEIPAEFRF